MFEQNTTPSTEPNPLNPVMPAPGMSDAQIPPAAGPTSFTPPPAQVHTMPERFRSGMTSGGGAPGGSGKTKKLVMVLVIVLVVAGLGVAGLFIFTKYVKTNTNSANLNTTNTVLANLNVSTVNTNTTANANTTANTNTVDANANSNLNTNTTTNTSTNTTSNTNTTTNTNTSTSVTKATSTTDSDTDGLTDTEEAIYGTNAKVADTDSDGFIDGEQVRADGSVIGEFGNLYNPKGAGNLENSGLVKRVENSSKTFSLLVPTTWTTNESASILVITPATQTNEFFQVRTYDNASNQTLAQWYQATNPQAQMSLTKSTAINGLEALISEDSTTVYFLKDTKVYGLNYSTGGLTQVNYWTTFDVMMKSFKLVAS